MELTLKRLLEQAEFTKTRGGGYDRGEVDDFLDRTVAMAAKVEARLTQALDEAKGAGGAPSVPAPSEADIEAEVQRRLEAHIAELPRAPSGPSEEETAEQVRRTIVLAERTANEAVREAREEAAALVAAAEERAARITSEADEHVAKVTGEADERAARVTSEADEHAARVTSEAEERAAGLNAETAAAAEAARAATAAEVAAERQAARNRLALEISSIEGVRESLRSDVSVLERHVEEQRTQLRSTVGELQRLLDDPAGFRLAPAPALLDPEVPDLSEPEPEPVAEEPAAPELDAEPEVEPEPEPAAEVEPEAAAEVEVEVEPEAVESEPEAEEAPAADPQLSLPPIDEAAEAVPGPEPLLAFHDELDPPEEPMAVTGAPGAVVDAVPGAPDELVAPRLDFAEVDHEEPGVIDLVDPGPPTVPVSMVELTDSAEGVDAEDDAFLAELRKAMADEEPLGPRDDEPSPPFMPPFEDEDRRGWRFGKRR